MGETTGLGSSKPHLGQFGRAIWYELTNCSSFPGLHFLLGLRITPGANSFIVLPRGISRSTAVGAILRLHGIDSPQSAIAVADSEVTIQVKPKPEPEVTDKLKEQLDVDFVFAISRDDKLVSRLNDVPGAETCSTSEKGSDAKWRAKPTDVAAVMWQFANAK